MLRRDHYRSDGTIGSYEGMVGFVPRRKRRAYLKALLEAMKNAHHQGSGVSIDPARLERLRKLARSP